MLNSAEHKIYHAHVKMPTIVGILTFISMINTTSARFKALTSSFVGIFVFMSSWNLVLSWVEHEKFYNLGASPGLQYAISFIIVYFSI